MKAILEKQKERITKIKDIVKLGDWLSIKTKGEDIICMVMKTKEGYNLVDINSGFLVLPASLDYIQNINKSLDQDNTEWEFIELKYKYKIL